MLARDHSVKRSAAAMVAKEVQAVATSSAATAGSLWVADITYVAIATGFVFLAAILDAWSRRVVGYAISRSIDARLTIAALDAAVRSRAPPAGCVHHSDRGSQGEF